MSSHVATWMKSIQSPVQEGEFPPQLCVDLLWGPTHSRLCILLHVSVQKYLELLGYLKPYYLNGSPISSALSVALIG